MQRVPDSHKGENGKVAIIGGSRHQHGAPLFSLLAAEASGVDLLFACVPACHAETAKAHCLNAQVHSFAGDELCGEDVDAILELLATVDCAVIGPGLGRDAAQLSCIEKIIASASCPLVLDASALQPFTLAAVRKKTVVLTPHRGELERMGIAQEDLAATAKKFGVTLLCKGQIDRIASPDGQVEEVEGGNAGLTVGGTGDALAGLAAGLIAQGMRWSEACRLASLTIKKAGDHLQARQGFSYRTQDVIETIPMILHGGGRLQQDLPGRGTLIA